MSDELMHYGTPRHSGRWPYGSGKDPYQSERDFLGTANQLRKEGLSEKEIADYFQMSLKELRSAKSNASAAIRAYNRSRCLELKDKGYSQSAIAREMGVGESTVRSWLKTDISEKQSVAKRTADMLETEVGLHKYVDIGGGVENMIGINANQLSNAVALLKDKGYQVMYVKTEQMGTGKYTSIKVLVPPGVKYSELAKNKDLIAYPGFYAEDHGTVLRKVEPPVSIDSKRIFVKYDEDGGSDKDGVIELRRGVEDISLGNARYAQVRIAVDGSHYLKGMAMYSDDIPEGYDIIFNTNKKKGTPLKGTKDNSVLKEMKSDQDNPFGATIRRDDELVLAQRHYIGKDGKEHQSALNIVNEEGNWNTWRKSLSSQMLSKQTTALAKRQLKLAYDLKKDEFDEIMSLENPTIKKKLLDKFADGCDSSAVNLKAAGLPRQASKVILPFPDMKENEIYAPSFRDGESVVLIRYPHGGIFEIPELTVNNKHRGARKTLGTDARDAVGINPKVAERLSGADFDGDTVLVIPTQGTKINTSAPLKGLKDFNPSRMYPAYPGMPEVKGSGFNKQRQMGDVSNLITDMTIKGASPDEICRAVRHSMVIIDAEKHNLNWKQSYIDNGIAGLKEKYQGGAKRGASTIISRASSDARPLARKEITNPKVMTDEERKRYFSGRKVYRETGETYTNKKGQTIKRTAKSTKMAEADDAYSLSSGFTIENIYADYANQMKALARDARKASISTTPISKNPDARKAYSEQVKSLDSKLNIALQNRPVERKAQLIAGAKVRLIRQANPDMDSDDIRKLRGRCITEARAVTGAKKAQIHISDKEWEAIQNGAISNHRLEQIIDNADLDEVKQLAMPRNTVGMSNAKVSRAKSMQTRGYTLAEIADALGVSVSTVNKALE